MKQKIKIMEHKPELSDEEIRSYMDFDNLVAKRKLITPASRLNRVLKFVIPAVIFTGSVTWFLFISDPGRSQHATAPEKDDQRQHEKLSIQLPDSSAKQEDTSVQTNKTVNGREKLQLPPIKKQSSSTVERSKTTQPQSGPTDDVYIQAEPADGYPALYAYFNKALIYPPDAVKDSVQGVQTVSFVINAEGKPRKIAVRQSLGLSFEKEAIRLIENMPSWKPATLNGKPVSSQVSLPLTFQIQRIKAKE